MGTKPQTCAAQVWGGQPRLANGRLTSWRRCKRTATIIQPTSGGDVPFCSHHHRTMLEQGEWAYVGDEVVYVQEPPVVAALRNLVEQIDVEFCIETGDGRRNSTLWPTLDEAKKVLEQHRKRAT